MTAPLKRPAPPTVGNSIDWTVEWLAPYRTAGERASQLIRAGQKPHDALNSIAASSPVGVGRPAVRFVPQSELPPGEAYEKYIFNSKRCPTREGFHDFFNGLCWLHFPATKKRLNALQAAQIEKDGINQQRGAVRDALTVFDENAAFMQAPDALWHALAAKDWHSLFVTLRPMWARAHLVLFGHALLEKLASPRKPMTAHVYRTHAATISIANLDAWVAADLTRDKLARKPFAHLPVLGVPGWWPANEKPDFYDDASVFRAPKPARQRLPETFPAAG